MLTGACSRLVMRGDDLPQDPVDRRDERFEGGGSASAHDLDTGVLLQLLVRDRDLWDLVQPSLDLPPRLRPLERRLLKKQSERNVEEPRPEPG